jgi:benzoyl-CoA reductase/2-hydroxyglutaryl-CoA dehydratase subunit BcrC/BadD/HgdB
MVTKKDVLFTCSYLPEEIIIAARLRPVRMVSDARPSDADTAIHPATCPYIRAVFAAAARGGAAGAAGTVIVNSCDGMRRLYDAVAALNDGPPVVFLDVPHKQDAAAVDLFADGLRRLAGQLEKQFGGARVTPSALERAITERNALRKKVAKVFEQQADGGPTGAAVLSLLTVIAAGNLQDADGRIDKLIASARGCADAARKRIVISANVLDRPDLVEMIEGAGGSVVALDTCTGARHWEGLVTEGSPDPMRAIAERYLTRPPCSRMEGIGRRVDWLVDTARSARADGVVLSTVKYCDAWLYDQPVLTEGLVTAGFAVLALENDYEWSGAHQMKTRIEAFLETLPKGGKQC